MVDYIKTFCVVDHRVKSHTKKDVQVFCHLVYSWISIFCCCCFFPWVLVCFVNCAVH